MREKNRLRKKKLINKLRRIIKHTIFPNLIFPKMKFSKLIFKIVNDENCKE